MPDNMPSLGKFKSSISYGNVLALAVAFVIVAAFNALINALVIGIVSPIIVILGHVNLASITYTINGSTFLVGGFIISAISSISITIAISFLVIKLMSKLSSPNKKPANAGITGVGDLPLPHIKHTNKGYTMFFLHFKTQVI